MIEAVHKVLCSLNNKIGSLHGKWAKELQGVDSSVKPVSISPGEVPQTIAGRNPGRTEIWIHNVSTKKLFLAPFEGEAGPNLFSLSIDPDDTLFLNAHNFAHLYKGNIYGFWEETAPAESRAMVTEFYIQKL
jgi:hypothetical protein